MHYVIGAVWVSEWVGVRPFLWLSGLAQGSHAGGRGSILRLDHQVSAAFVTTRAKGYTFFFLWFFKDHKP